MRLADEDEEGGLQGVLGIVVVAEDTATDAPDHRAVPPHQRFEGRSFSAAHEALQQLSVGQVRSLQQLQGAAQVLDDLAHLGGHFLPFLAGNTRPPPLHYPHEGDWMRHFPKTKPDTTPPLCPRGQPRKEGFKEA